MAGPQPQGVEPQYAIGPSQPTADRATRRASRRDRLRRYRMRLDSSKRWRKDACYDDTWKRLIDLYRGKHFTSDDLAGGDDKIAVNVSFSTVNVIGPSVSVNYPKITVNARQPEMEDQATFAEAVINYWWRHYDWQPEVRKAVKDSLIIGHGWAKIGWRYEEEEQPLDPDAAQEQVEGLQQQASDYAAQNPELADQVPTDEEIAQQAPTTQTVAKHDYPFVERVSPFDVYVDPEATCDYDMKWVAQKVVMPLEEAQQNPRYRRSARKDLRPDAATNPRWRDQATETDRDKSKYDDDVKRVTVWEFYDVRDETMCIFAEFGDDFLVEPQPMPYPFAHPFVYLGNYDVPDQFYSLGDLEMLEPLQQELNLTRSAMVNHRKKYARAYIARREAFNPESRGVLESDEDNRIVYVDGDDPLDQLIKPIEITPLDPQLYQYSDVIEGDMELVSGVSEYQRGALSETRRTATEASIIQDAANARAAEKLASTEVFIREIAERVLKLAQQYVTGEQYARVIGAAGAQLWVPFTRDDIDGEFDFEVEAGSTQPRNDAFKKQQALQLLNTLSPFVGTTINPQALVEYVLREGFDIKNPERFFMAPMIDPNTGLPIDPNTGLPVQQQAAPPQQQQQGSPDIGDGTTLPTSGPGAIPPEVLTQLQGQVGLNLENV